MESFVKGTGNNQETYSVRDRTLLKALVGRMKDRGWTKGGETQETDMTGFGN